MLKILNQPYPFSEKTLTQIFKQSVLEGCFIALFLIIIQPFGIANTNFPNKTFVLASFGFVTAITVFFLRFIIFKNFEKYKDQANWTVLKEIISIFLLLILITLGNLILTYFLFNFGMSFKGFRSMFFMVISIGIFPTVFGVMANYIYQLKKFKNIIDVKYSENDCSGLNYRLKFIAENDKDFVELDSKKLLFIESSDNYSTIYFLNEDKLQKELIRSSLSRLESQIDSNHIVRCHRSFIVNLEKVGKVTGNAQGYKLHLNTNNLVIPVARKNSDLVQRFKTQSY